MPSTSLRRLGTVLFVLGIGSAFLAPLGGNFRLLAFFDAAGPEVGIVLRFALIMVGLGLMFAADRGSAKPLPAAPTRASDIVFYALFAATTASVIGSIHYVFYVVPEEATMGIVQKIFYFHVPSAYAFYLGATACFIGSGGFLVTQSSKWDAFGRAGADLSVALGLMVMITGPLWAAKSWGVYWTWDPRLTTMLLSLLIYFAYCVLRAFSGGGDAERKFAAALGILGGATLPIIHFAVKKWGGTHPEVITGKGGGLSDARMGIGLALGFLSFTLLTALFVWARMRQHLSEVRLEEVEQEALARGLVED